MEGMFQLRRNTAVEMQEFEEEKLQQESMAQHTGSVAGAYRCL